MRMMVRFEEYEFDALVQSAQDEKRNPRDQAILLMREGLERRGLLARPRARGAQGAGLKAVDDAENDR